MRLGWPEIWERFLILCRGFGRGGTSALSSVSRSSCGGHESVTELAVCLLDVFYGGVLFSPSATVAEAHVLQADVHWAVPGPHSSSV